MNELQDAINDLQELLEETQTTLIYINGKPQKIVRREQTGKAWRGQRHSYPVPVYVVEERKRDESEAQA